MLKIISFLLTSVVALNGPAQSLASLNFSHQYDPTSEVSLAIKVVREQNQMTVHYRLQRNQQSGQYSIEWQRYETFMQRNGTVVISGDTISPSGKLSFPIPDKSWLLRARVTSKSGNDTWNFVQVIDPKYPTIGYLEDEEGLVFKNYIPAGKPVTLRGAASQKELTVYYYKTDFPIASPPFAQKGAHVDRFMFSDSIFKTPNGARMAFYSKGLYLVQQDTLASEGFSFMVTGSAYPKLTKVVEIPEPLVYICTREEHDELLAAGTDKAKVDKVILDITGDRDRAKNFMRSYFRRVELSNTWFSAFKDGWKTDRGMIYLIFGLPDEVSKTGPNEIWSYHNTKDRFTFVKTGSVYDPNHMVLVRDIKFTQQWFSTVDLWRKSRF